MNKKAKTSYYTAQEIENFFSFSFRLAQEAAQAGEVPVGAVLVFKGKVIAAERNRIKEKKDPSAHAELLAIQAAARKLNNERLSDCELFTTLEPCLMCSGAIVLARLHFVHFLAIDQKLPAFQDVMQNEHLNHYCGFCHYPHLHNASALLSQFFQEKRKGNKSEKFTKKF